MKTRLLLLGAAALGALAASSGIAAAANAYTTGNVNMRAGPSTQYPQIVTLPRGATVEVYGCTSGWQWCDAEWRGYRGWVSATYLETLYQNRRVYVPDYAPRVGVPVITFSFGSYWDRHYRDRPWYRDRDRWDGGWDRDDRRRERVEIDRPRERRRDFDRPPPQWRPDRDERPAEWRSQRDEIIVRPRSPDEFRREFRGDGESRRSRRANEDTPPGQRGRDRCPPGLQKQGRC
ncbi:SH3 domain-containing protein [Chelativorans sp.]|uniref:SH3 domain-containing protein n=1 Tax=Chelativorans sp. TaxID=2203393 RepID=UPI002810F719|nr:SH3 domain-containing protein [Chelativorans sp.]